MVKQISCLNSHLSTLSAEVQDEAIFNGQPPPESAHLIWTKLIELYGKSKCDDALEVESMENMSIMSSCSKEASQDLKSAEPEQEAQARWWPSDESTSVSHDTHHLCLMAKKSKKKASKKDQAKEIARVDDQEESDIEIEDSYTLDHLSNKDKLILMKLVEKNDELEEENEKQEQSLQNQEKFLISKLQELKVINERYEKLSVEHALVTNSSSSVSQLDKENFELKAKLDELSSKYNVLQANYVHLSALMRK